MNIEDRLPEAPPEPPAAELRDAAPSATQRERDANGRVDAAPSRTDARPAMTASEPLDALDVLFVIDNSASMATEQDKLARELPRLVGVLTSGDRYAGRPVPPGLPPEQRLFKPVHSVHLGVVSTNVGGLQDALGSRQEAVMSCLGGGDDGKLQSSTKLAVKGVTAETDLEFEGYAKGEVVIAARPGCDLPPLPPYQEYVAGQGSSVAFVCTARLGVRGCPFEQPLESAWKALAPSAKAGSDALYSFVQPAGGQGDRANAGFLREDAALAVIVLSDEDDCSVTTAGASLFALTKDADDQYGALNLRCGRHQDDPALMQPVERYVRGLQSLKPGHPERIVFGAITGVPPRAIEQNLGYEAILALPEMAFAEAKSNLGEGTGLPRHTCSKENPPRPADTAYPGTRLVKTAQAFGAQAVLESICADEYGSALDRVIDKLVPLFAP